MGQTSLVRVDVLVDMDDFDGVLDVLRLIWKGLNSRAEATLTHVFPDIDKGDGRRSPPFVSWSGEDHPHVVAHLHPTDLGKDLSHLVDFPKMEFNLRRWETGSHWGETSGQFVAKIAKIVSIGMNSTSARQRPKLCLYEVPDFLPLGLLLDDEPIDLDSLQTIWPRHEELLAQWFFNFQRASASEPVDLDRWSKDPEYLAAEAN